jgi:ferric-dicitrate binding protein FerR (iron transport regulator)
MLFSVEELVINDSFILYCLEKDPIATSYWTSYLNKHPEQLTVIEEAKVMVLGLRKMLHEKHSALEAFENRTKLRPFSPQQVLKVAKNTRKISASKKWISAAAILLVVGLSLFFYILRDDSAKSNFKPTIFAKAAQKVISKASEQKTVILSDGTKVTMNAQSELYCSKGFGVQDRNVYLKGEALFDVAHNKELPFIVHLEQNFKVKAIGTKFNIKDYSNDVFSEISLLEGKVQVLQKKLKRDTVLETLQVNQKMVVKNNIDSSGLIQRGDSKVVPLLYNANRMNVETAWVDDYLIFENQSLYEIKNVLERRFGVSIIIKDEALHNYRYTATFENEKIEDILKSLQLSYPFAYRIKERQ